MSENSEAVIRFEDVRKTYRIGTVEVHALAGVSFSFQEGSFWAVMGPSGSGKSTMLNLFGCLDRPTSGQYWLAGQDVARMEDDDLSEIRLSRIGFVFQSFNLIPQLTVRENIELPLFYLGHTTAECGQRSTELAEMVGLSDRLEHRPVELSGGQQQRVAVARALVNDPSVILADEPTGNLDTTTGLQIMDLLASLSEQGKTIVMVTHEAEIASYARSRLHMRDGKVESLEEDG